MNGFSSSTASRAVDLLERELTCPICTELLFDPVTFLNCLHTNCGSCAKKWFSRTTPSAACSPPALHSCPVCRKRVREWRTSPLVASLLDGFLALHPERRRSAEEQRMLRDIWRPGDELLPPAVMGDDGEDGTGVEAVIDGEHTRRRPSTMQMVLRQRARAPTARTIATEPSSPASPTFPSLGPSRRRASTSTPSTPRPPSPPLAVQRRMSRTPSPRDPPDPNAPPLPPPTSVLEILHRGINPIIITCDSCSVRLDTAVHHECATCPLFHLCLRCSLTTEHPHPLHRQKLHSIWPRRNLITGIFCDVCDSWCDEDRNNHSRLSSVFFHCNSCNGGNWAYCLRCVQRGWSCTHELELWSNTRNHPPLSSPLLRGNPAAIPSTRILRRLDYAPWSPVPVSSSSSSSSSQSSISSPISSSQAPPSPPMNCAICTLPIPPTSALLHCFSCPDAAADMCTTCYYNLHRTFPDENRARHRFFSCARGHGLCVLAVPGKVVKHRAVGALVSRPRLPEWVVYSSAAAAAASAAAHTTTNPPTTSSAVSTLSSSSSASATATGDDSGLSGVVARRAIAVRGYWPDEGDADEEASWSPATASSPAVAVAGDGTGEAPPRRRWGKGQWLCFPEGAEVWDVVRVFGRRGSADGNGGGGGGGGDDDDCDDDGDDGGGAVGDQQQRLEGGSAWCWGSFAGTAGLFPEECVRFVT